MKNCPYSESTSGFTLVEVMIGLVIAMILLGGLVLNFLSQSSEYKYQDKRVDAAQDLEFAMRYIASDLRSALLRPDAAELGGVGGSSIGLSGSGENPSTFLSFTVWDETNGAAVTKEALRCYQLDSGMLKYAVASASCPPATALPDGAAILGEPGNGSRGLKVTHFRVFRDNDLVVDGDRANYVGIPDPLPTKTYINFDLVRFQIPAFTVLIEVEVDSTKKASATDVLDNSVTNGKGKMWRYMQVYPAVVIDPVVP